ncbi:hypothetical protein FM114_13740 [Luteococcus japonicus LSP_Lj1]|uniref:Uncharacterized protein n=1 Tax=Luteococcus japonicus LSP_Lj1 TaxID=1255658 RepID=A0A1R4KFH6_9ACTN|nr:hypothetical protein FM114_13740 [Luteococcus japonicus LSP_Lj1]
MHCATQHPHRGPGRAGGMDTSHHGASHGRIEAVRTPC